MPAAVCSRTACGKITSTPESIMVAQLSSSCPFLPMTVHTNSNMCCVHGCLGRDEVHSTERTEGRVLLVTSML